jgi:hypothetical protein
MSLLARLRQGPLAADDFAEVAASRRSLAVRIHNLREQGFSIESIGLPNGNRRPKAEYRLVAGTCPCCERELTA